jgi:hypothetical protein
MQMFDEEIATLIKSDGTVEQKHWLIEDALKAEAMQEACGMFLTAERKFRKLNVNPDCVTDPRLNVEWWDALERVHWAERTVWRLFAGPQPTMADNKLYGKFREMLLKGSSLKANG